MNLSSKLYKTPLMGIIEFSSTVTQAVLEKCVLRKEVDGSNGKKYQVRLKYFYTQLILSLVFFFFKFKKIYNFKYLNWCEKVVGKNGKEKRSPMLPLMVTYAPKLN